MNFVALLVLAEFDDYFVEIFLRSRVNVFLEKDIPNAMNFSSPKIEIKFTVNEKEEDDGQEKENNEEKLGKI